jgi:hypothetical protein
MPEPTFAMTVDDDLPRTIRRERDAQREAREREARELQAQARDRRAAPGPAPAPDTALAPEVLALRAPGVAIVDIDMPFAKLASFFIKAVFAAVPALLMLTAMLWVFGQMLQTFFPHLLKLKILIYMPQ